jgi:N-acetylglucosaminyldiphosphoundecaprenol N-acetyl-beta-D-mannosaminyltransferase
MVFFDFGTTPMGDSARLRSTGSNPDSVFPLDDYEFRIHGVKVHALQTDNLVTLVHQWLLRSDKNNRQFHYLVSTNINNVVCALESPKYAQVMERADLSVPDGVPLLWLGRMRGHKLPSRCGIEEVMLAVFELSNQGYDYSHFFYGNSEEVLAELRKNLKKKYPNLNIVGMYSPPFRELTEEEHAEHIDLINNTAPDFLCLSLGCPKQELWLFENKDRLNAGLGGGAGAVFNFLSGHSPRAPEWSRMMGLEWLIRLCSEPTRLWHRYLVRYPKFIYYLIRPPAGP